MADILMDLRIMSLKRQFQGVSNGKLVEWARAGRISPQDQVAPAGSGQWQAVTEVPWLAVHLPSHAASNSALAEDELLEEEIDPGWVTTKKRRRHDEAEIDMTPMIDVTFQLLIFFMLTNSLTNPAPIAVPEAVHGVGISPDGHQMLLVDQDGKFYLGEKVDAALEVDLNDVATKVQENVGGSGGLDVIVSAHRHAKHSAVRQLVEKLGTVSGIGQITLGVEEKR